VNLHLNSCGSLLSGRVCLSWQNGPSIPAVLASVIINSSDLLRVDLTGVHVVLPRLLSALEDLQQKFRFVM